MTDYNVAVFGFGVNYYSASFNSADYECDTASACSTTQGAACWWIEDSSDDAHPSTATIESDGSGISFNITGGNVEGGDAVMLTLVKLLDDLGDMAVSAYVRSITLVPYAELLTDNASEIAVGIADAAFSGGFSFEAGTSKYDYAMYDGWALDQTTEEDDIYAVPSASGVFSSIASAYYSPIYYCMVRKDYVVRSYISTDGEVYTQVATSNIECSAGSAGCGLSSFVDYPATDTTGFFFMGGENSVDGEVMTGKFRYMRFNVTDIEGSASDCP